MIQVAGRIVKHSGPPKVLTPPLSDYILTSVTLQVILFYVIKTFADKHTRELFNTGKSKRLPANILKRAIRRLEYIDLATCLDDLKVPPSNRLHPLKRESEGQFSISISDQWRICFRFIDGDAYDVEITDYH